MATFATRFSMSMLAYCVLSIGLVHIVGCGQEKAEPEIQTRTGTVLSIDEATGKVAMSFYHKKKQIEVTIEGTVTPQTEILINGRIAKMNEVKIGEKVTVTGRVEKDGARTRLVATKVVIERAEWTKASQPASQATTTTTDKPAQP